MGNNNSSKRPKPTIIEKRDESSPQVTLDEAYESLEEYKEAVNNVYSLSCLLDDYADDIRKRMHEGDTNPINSVLLTTLHEGYDKNTAKNYCEVIELGLNMDSVRSSRMLFSCKHYEELDGVSILEMRNRQGSTDGLSMDKFCNLLEYRILDISKKIPSNGRMYIHAGLGLWTRGVRVYFNIIRRDPVLNNKWIMVSCGINLDKYTKIDVSNLQLFSKEYKTLMENITHVMNSNTYLNIINESVLDAKYNVDMAIEKLEEKNSLLLFARQILDNAPNDVNAIKTMNNATIEVKNASKMTTSSMNTMKVAQQTMNEAEHSIALKTTTWEFGSAESYDTLRCVYSGIVPEWSGNYIKDCNLRNNPNMDIPGNIFNVMSDIEHYYPDLYHGQIVLSTYKMDDKYYIVIVRIIMREDKQVHIQLKDALLNSIFTTSLMNGNGIQNSQEQSFFIDPIRRFIGIGTNINSVNYEENYVTTKHDKGQNVVIQSNTYPNMVGARIAENSGHVPGGEREKNYYFFDQFSSATMRRKSNLYTFEQMYNYTEEGNDSDCDYSTNRKYGNDISFEITDRTNVTKEIGNIGMTIDRLDDEGKIYGGLSVKTVPDIDISGRHPIVKPGKTIMYVSSDGLLHIKGIMLGSKELHVEFDEEDGEESLYWGEKKIK